MICCFVQGDRIQKEMQISAEFDIFLKTDERSLSMTPPFDSVLSSIFQRPGDRRGISRESLVTVLLTGNGLKSFGYADTFTCSSSLAVGISGLQC